MKANATTAPLPAFKRRHYVGACGHYEDELRRKDRRWLFARKQSFNEQRRELASSPRNPPGRDPGKA